MFFKMCMYASDAAYTPELLSKPESVWILDKIDVEGDAYGQSVVAHHKTENLIVVAFRGTIITSINNLLTDIDYAQIDYPQCKNCKVHKGFKTHFEEMSAMVQNSLAKARKARPTAKIICTGHSLGAALAIVFAVRLYENVPSLRGNIQLVTYGSPRVGNQAFVNYVNTFIGESKIFVVVYKGDPITSVPLVKQNYKHIGNGIRYKFSTNNSFAKENYNDSDPSFLAGLSTVWHANDHRQYTSIKDAQCYRRRIRRVLRKMK